MGEVAAEDTEGFEGMGGRLDSAEGRDRGLDNFATLFFGRLRVSSCKLWQSWRLSSFSMVVKAISTELSWLIASSLMAIFYPRAFLFSQKYDELVGEQVLLLLLLFRFSGLRQFGHFAADFGRGWFGLGLIAGGPFCRRVSSWHHHAV